MKKMILLLIVYLSWALSISASITLNGSGSFIDITSALSSAGQGDIIEITDNGTYYESLLISVANITIRGADGVSPTIAFDSAAPVIQITSNKCRIENIKILVKDFATGGIYISSYSNTIENCEFITENPQISMYAVFLDSQTGNRVINCRIHSGYTYGIKGTFIENLLIAYNVIYGCTYGIRIYDTTAINAEYNIFNNTIVGCITNGISITESGSTFWPVVNLINNISYYNDNLDIYLQSDMSVLSANLENNCYNKLFDDKLNSFNVEVTITSSPEFVNLANNDYRLSGNSPCIDAGANINYSLYNFTAPKIIGKARDIGAFEYESPERVYPKNKYLLLSNNKITPGKKVKIVITGLQKINNTSVHIKASIYNLQNVLIKELYDGMVDSSKYKELSWDGTGQDNEYVSSGTYIIKVRLGSIVIEKKIFFIK